MPVYEPWTEERLTSAKTMWVDGKSAAEISRALGGTSRNAVLAKLHRTGFLGNGFINRAAPTTPAAMPTRGNGRPKEDRAAVARAIDASHAPLKFIAVVPDDSPEAPVPVASADPVGCRWPIGDPRAAGFRFCEAPPVLGRTYCPDHCRRAGQSVTPKFASMRGQVAAPYRLFGERRA